MVASVQVVAETCVVCSDGTSDLQPFWRLLKRCQRCGHCVAALEEPPVDLAAMYDREYFCGEEYADYLRDRPIFERQFRQRLKLIRRFQPAGDLIEVGCAYGFFLAVAREAYRVRGFDVANEAVTYAREQLGVDARCEDFVDAAVEPASADVVVMWDTVEHLARPDLMLEKAASVLRPGGFLFLTTGDIDSALARAQRTNWRLIHPPTHLHYFSRATMRRLLERLGLRPVEITYEGVRRSVRQIAFGLLCLGKPQPSRLYRLIASSPLAGFSISLNTYDIMLVVAQKPTTR